jgi:hypothetical protein
MAQYDKALELTRAMLDAAQKSDWDGLVVLEKERTAIIDHLRGVDTQPPRDATVRERKRGLIQEIMRHDEQVQMLTQDWMRELREVLGSISAEHKLSRTYGA